MITIELGKKLVSTYNQVEGKSLSGAEFFYDVFYPLALDGEKYFFWLRNSPFVQRYKKTALPDAATRREWLDTFESKLEPVLAGKASPDASIAPGYPARGFSETTSGQAPDTLPSDKDSMLYAWIGSCLGIGCNGKINLCLLDNEILYSLFQGWKVYRKYLDEDETLKGNQIETWNAHWLLSQYSEGYALKPDRSGGESRFVTPFWLDLVTALAYIYPRPISAYLYSYGNMNISGGFVTLYLDQVKRLHKSFSQVLETLEVGQEEASLKAFTGKSSLNVVAGEGVLDLVSLRPKHIEKYMVLDELHPKRRLWEKRYGSLEQVYPLTGSQKSKITFATYKSYLMAYFDEEVVVKNARLVAEKLFNYRMADKKGRTGRKREIGVILKTKNQRNFVLRISEVIKKSGTDALLKNAAEEAAHLPRNEYLTFMSLLNLQYNELDQKK